MFDISLLDAGFLAAAVVALLAGVLSFLSPCVLPIVPPYLAYMGGISLSDMNGARRRSAVIPALFFVLGLSTVFLLMGIAASAFGRLILGWQDYLSKGSGLIVFVLGLHFLGILRIPLLDRDARLDAGDQGGTALGAYVLGLAFAFGWTPCIGPQLSAILSLAANGASVTRGAALLAIYAAGLGIPFILAAIFITRSVALMKRLKPYMGIVEKCMGALLLLVGLALFFGAFSRFSYWILELFPFMAQIG